VETSVGDSGRGWVTLAGWNGVDVGEALGFGVTSTSGGGSLTDVGSVQAVSSRQNVKHKA
jgi:hypothetical protein